MTDRQHEAKAAADSALDRLNALEADLRAADAPDRTQMYTRDIADLVREGRYLRASDACGTVMEILRDNGFRETDDLVVEFAEVQTDLTFAGERLGEV